jgi:F-type H+-transporting ATPase subunit b
VELDLSTILLEVINFLVLVWILKRFLYKPVLGAIERRKAAVAKDLADAEARAAEAQKLDQQYQNRLADWEHEKQQLRGQLAEELVAQRERMMLELRTALDQEREKENVLAQRRMEEVRRRAEAEGTAVAAQFAARLLARTASPELEQKLTGLAIEDLPRLPDPQREALRAACGGSTLHVSSAFPIPTERQTAILEALKKVVQYDLTATFEEDPTLLAGLRIRIGAWTVRANLADELVFFTEMVTDDRGKDWHSS